MFSNCRLTGPHNPLKKCVVSPGTIRTGRIAGKELIPFLSSSVRIVLISYDFTSMITPNTEAVHARMHSAVSPVMRGIEFTQNIHNKQFTIGLEILSKGDGLP